MPDNVNERTDRLAGRVNIGVLVDYFEANSLIASGPMNCIHGLTVN